MLASGEWRRFKEWGECDVTMSLWWFRYTVYCWAAFSVENSLYVLCTWGSWGRNEGAKFELLWNNGILTKEHNGTFLFVVENKQINNKTEWVARGRRRNGNEKWERLWPLRPGNKLVPVHLSTMGDTFFRN